MDAKEYLEMFNSLSMQGWEASFESDIDAIAGMGGSIIAGMAARDITGKRIEIVNGYDFPSWLSGTLLASSYSGNTEETLKAVAAARRGGMEIIAISSGGKLLDMAKRMGWKYVEMPKDLQPREAFPFSLFAILRMLGHGKPRKFKPSLKGLKRIARKLHGKIPHIISHSFLSSAGYRFKTQLNENSKVPAFYETLPEMNHNSLVGIKSKLYKHIQPVFIRDKEEGRNGLRYEIMKRLGMKAVEIHSEGKTRLERYVSVVIKGDVISYILAEMYGVDAKEVEIIHKLKRMLKEGL